MNQSSVIYEILYYLGVTYSIDTLFHDPISFLSYILLMFFALMLVLAVFKVFAMVIRIFLDWRTLR